MSGHLQHGAGWEGDDGDARCRYCGADAAGPCARCDAPVCGSCCVLTEGGARTYAICVACARAGGRSLRAAWWTVARWVMAPLALLAGIVALLSWLGAR